MSNSDNSGRKPVSVVAIGAGNRAGKYIHYILKNPDMARLVGIVEPNDLRRSHMASVAGLPEECCYADWHDFFATERRADAVMICTPDRMHFEQCMAAMEKGYHVLLEKPVARTPEECRAIVEGANRHGVTVSVCHVLRYHPYFEKMKEIARSGSLGKIVSVNHRASVGIDRAAHSYVRGIWRREDTSNPMILSKCCHDLDFLVWLTGSRYRKLSSFGSLRWFRAEEAPEGSAPRCISCNVEENCPFSAVNLYRTRREWIANFDVPYGKTIGEVIEEELEHGRLGRCVYHCDNTVVDHQVVAMEMENDVTVTMSMDCFTLHDNRETHICLTGGEIFGNERAIEVFHFRSGRREVFDFSHLCGKPFHAGADLRLVEDFLKAVTDPTRNVRTELEEAIESHRICFAAEKSRNEHRMV